MKSILLSRSIWCFVILFCALLLPTSARAQDSDEGQIPLQVEILAPEDNCQLLLGSESSVSFGQIAQPTGEQTVSRALDPVDPSTNPAGTTLADLSLQTNVARDFTLTVTPPADLAHSTGTSLIDYALGWAQRGDDDSPFEGVVAASYSGNTGADGAHAFRFGGAISEITAATVPGLYTAQMNVSISCN